MQTDQFTESNAKGGKFTRRKDRHDRFCSPLLFLRVLVDCFSFGKHKENGERRSERDRGSRIRRTVFPGTLSKIRSRGSRSSFDGAASAEYQVPGPMGQGDDRGCYFQGDVHRRKMTGTTVAGNTPHSGNKMIQQGRVSPSFLTLVIFSGRRWYRVLWTVELRWKSLGRLREKSARDLFAGEWEIVFQRIASKVYHVRWS